MSSPRRLLLTGLTAALLAIAILAAAFATGLLPSPNEVKTQGGGIATGPTGSTQGATGKVSIMLTDPPVLPAGVTAVYISYSGISLHIFDQSSNDWFNVKVAGTVDILKLINVSKTIAVADVPANTYDQVKVNISSVQAVYNGRNYSVSIDRNEIVSVINGYVNVYASTNVSILIDIQTTLLNTNSESSPNFVFTASAWSAELPVHAQSAISRVGQSTNLTNAPWFNTFRKSYSANITITSASLSSNEISVTVKNIGNASTTLKLLLLSPSVFSMVQNPPRMSPMVIPAFLVAEVFTILPNGTLAPLPFIQGQVCSDAATCSLLPVSNSTGYLLEPGASVVLTYVSHGNTILPGYPTVSEYIITVIGTGSVASTTVKT